MVHFRWWENELLPALCWLQELFLLLLIGISFTSLRWCSPIQLKTEPGWTSCLISLQISPSVPLRVSACLSVSFPLSPPIPFLHYPVPQFLASLTSNLYLSDTDVWVFPPCTWNCTQAIIWDSHKLYFICFSFLRDHRPYIFCCLVPKNCCFALFLMFSFFKAGG